MTTAGTPSMRRQNPLHPFQRLLAFCQVQAQCLRLQLATLKLEYFLHILNLPVGIFNHHLDANFHDRTSRCRCRLISRRLYTRFIHGRSPASSLT